MNTYKISRKNGKFHNFNFNMIQNSMNTPYAKRVAEKFKEAQNYLKTNGFGRSTDHLLEEIENTVER